MLIFGVISGFAAEKLKNAGRVSWPALLGGLLDGFGHQ